MVFVLGFVASYYIMVFILYINKGTNKYVTLKYH